MHIKILQRWWKDYEFIEFQSNGSAQQFLIAFSFISYFKTHFKQLIYQCRH